MIESVKSACCSIQTWSIWLGIFDIILGVFIISQEILFFQYQFDHDPQHVSLDLLVFQVVAQMVFMVMSCLHVYGASQLDRRCLKPVLAISILQVFFRSIFCGSAISRFGIYHGKSMVEMVLLIIVFILSIVQWSFVIC